jgi:hypothetical protein
MNQEQLHVLKQAHADGAIIQALVLFSAGFTAQWTDVPSPMWNGCTEYRIKPIRKEHERL